jgi:hypothetical protein
MNEPTKDNIKLSIVTFLAGLLLGVLIPLAVIDDADEFRIWGTDKVFKKVSPANKPEQEHS